MNNQASREAWKEKHRSAQFENVRWNEYQKYVKTLKAVNVKLGVKMFSVINDLIE